MYVFALVLSPPPPTVIIGIAPTPITWVEVGCLAAAVQVFDLATYTLDEPNMLQTVIAHDRVIQELFHEGAVLPLRFGTIFVSEPALREHISQQAAAYHSQLTQLVGLAEFTIKLIPQEPPAPPNPPVPSSGRAYFAAKKQAFNEVECWQAAAAAEQTNFLQALQAQFEGRYLLGAERVNLLLPKQLESALRNWMTSQPLLHWQCTITGPLPPYHFV